MIVRGFRRAKAADDVNAKGFDAFELRLGDLMRGERATMGKSLLDVQRELKIKAAYIAAIENSDPTAFDTPGFIAGYVRSYARYLNMDPDWAFDTFCRESGFATAHGMSAEASAAKPVRMAGGAAVKGNDIFSSSATPYIPANEAMFSRVEPGAVGSMMVLIALIGGLGYGGWTVLQEVQRVQFAPVEQTPTVVSDIDPLAGASAVSTGETDLAGFAAPSTEALDRLYRPQALDVPVLVSRDAPIGSLNPSSFGAFATAQITPAAWVRVRSADGSIIFESVMEPGDSYVVPSTEDPATLRIGESGAVYFAVNGTHYGPVGPSGQVTSNVALSVESLTAAYTVADIDGDTALADVVRVAEAAPLAVLPIDTLPAE